jgi:hypothetical protein
MTTPLTAYMAGATTTAVQACQLCQKFVVEHVQPTAVGFENAADLKFRQNPELGPCVDSFEFRPQVSRLWLAIAAICCCGKPSPPALESETLARLAG